MTLCSLCINFTSLLTIMVDIHQYKVCAPWTFILDNINFNLSLSTIVECTCDDCIVVFFSHRREDGKGEDERESIGGSYGGCYYLLHYMVYMVLKGSSSIELEQGFMDWVVGGCWFIWGRVDKGCIDAMYNFMHGESRYRKEMKG